MYATAEVNISGYEITLAAFGWDQQQLTMVVWWICIMVVPPFATTSRASSYNHCTCNCVFISDWWLLLGQTSINLFQATWWPHQIGVGSIHFAHTIGLVLKAHSYKKANTRSKHALKNFDFGQEVVSLFQTNQCCLAKMCTERVTSILIWHLYAS